MKEDECGKTENKQKRVDEEDGIFPFEKKGEDNSREAGSRAVKTANKGEPAPRGRKAGLACHRTPLDPDERWMMGLQPSGRPSHCS
jgi:hypothetical protein